MRMLSRFEWTLSCATVVARIGLAPPALADTACTGEAPNTIVKYVEALGKS